MSTIPAKAFATAHDRRDDPFHGFGFKAAPVIANVPVTYLASVAYALCHPLSGTGNYTAEIVSSVPGTRGPRTAALSRTDGPRNGSSTTPTRKGSRSHRSTDGRPPASSV